MKKLIVTFLFFFILTLLATGQKSALDSLKFELKKTSHIQDSLLLLAQIASQYYPIKEKTRDSLITYSHIALDMAEHLGNDTLYIKMCQFYATGHNYRDTAIYFSYMKRAENKALYMGDFRRAARSSYYQSSRWESLRVYEKSIVCAERSLNQLLQNTEKLALTKKDLVLQSRLYKRMLSSNLRLNRIDTSLELIQELRDFAYQHGLIFSKLESYLSFIEIYSSIIDNNDLTTIEGEKNRYDSLLLTSIDSLYVLSQDNNKPSIKARHGYALVCYGDYYFKHHELDKAMDYHRRGYVFSEKHELEFSWHHSLLGIIRTAMLQEDWRTTKLYLNKSAELTKILNDPVKEAELNELHLEYYARINDLGKSRIYYDKLVAFVNASPNPSMYTSIYDNLYNFAYRTKDYNNALQHYILKSELTDSLKAMKMATQLEMIQKKYDIAKKNEEIYRLKEYHSQQSLHNTRRFALIGTISLLSLLAMAIIALTNRNRRVKMEKQSENLKQRLLRSQINPHFTFNALGTVQNYIYADRPQEAGDYLAKIARLIRRNLEFTNLKSITLSEEVEFIKNYLEVEKERSRNLFDFSVQYGDSNPIIGKRIQPLFVQPLVENSMKHGFKRMSHGGHIRVDYKIDESLKTLTVVVRDNGCGFEKSQGSVHKSLGLALIKDRIDLLNRQMKKPSYSLEINSMDSGTIAKIKMPYV